MPKKKTTVKKKVANKKTANKPAKSLSLGSKIKSPKVQLKNPRRILAVSIIVFVLVCIAAWWQFIFAEPNRVLSDMLAGNLRTPGVTKEVKQGGGANTITRNSYLSFIDGPKSQSVTTLVQQGADGTNKVVTENVGTPEEDYIRYMTIEVSTAGGQTDASSVENVWASRSGGSGQLGGQANFLNENLFGVAAFGNFNQEEADGLKDILEEKDVYNYSAVERTIEDGRLVYKYQIEFSPAVLIGYLSEYARLLGIDHKGQLDPKNYQNTQPIQAIFSVDVLSRQLTRIEYASTGRVEDYQGFGLKREIEIPDETISVSELQKRLQLAQ